jgi:hypothetical protein
MRPVSPFVVCLSVFLGAQLPACATQTHLSAAIRSGLSQQHVGSVVQLRASCFYGDLYDENDLWLLSPYTFASTSHIVDLKGLPLHPQKLRGLWPAGSRFVVERLEFPTRWAMARRMLVTPRFNPWVYLRRLPEPGEPVAKEGGEPLYVWVLPEALESSGAVESALAAALAPDGTVTQWLQTLQPTHKIAVQHKEILVGMPRAALLAAMGEPQRFFADQQAGRRVTVAWYADREAWLLDEVVVEVRPSRALAEEPAVSP